MHDAAAVRRAERVGDLQPDVDHAVRRQRSLGGNRLVERPPFEQLADEERLPIRFAGVVDGADVRMRDERCDPRFAPEALERARPRHFFRTQQLDRDVALEAQIARPIDFGRPVASDPGQDLVVRYAKRSLHGWVVEPTRRAYSARAASRGAKSASAFFQMAKSSS